MIISHLYKSGDSDKDWVIQSNDDHCVGVASLAARFASEFGLGNWGKIIGLLHDRGKEKSDFQNYIRYSSGFDTSRKSWSDKSHSLIGAIIVHKEFCDPFKMMPNAIAGHHRGLYDTDELETLLTHGMPPEIDTRMPDIVPDKPAFKLCKEDVHHLGRMLFSCLVDADYLDTEAFTQQTKSEMRARCSNLEALRDSLASHLAALRMNAKGNVNGIRRMVQDHCEEASKDKPGFYSLTVPTGGGKTLASMLWAISHALHNFKRRIIVAIPYTSIIVQTAQALRNIFGDENVLEHHSAVDENSMSESNKLAAENWDAPIVVTTNVQLFESMFSNHPGKCRKLHSLCNSVVILDETQSLPLSFFQPICDAMQSYSRLFGTSFLFCTASQPIMDGERKGLGNAVFKGIQQEKIKPLIPESLNLHDRLRRVSIEFEGERRTAREVASRLSEYEKVLCIVNSRKLAKEIYDNLEQSDAENIHLSKMMCPLHIKSLIEYVKETLRLWPCKKMRVVSTQLIEAGVDIDFPVVYRQFCGLDSILQAAGRCNREGALECGRTYVFSSADHRDYGSIKFASDAMRSLLNQNGQADWFSPQTMNEYYKILYTKTPSFDDKRIADLYCNPQKVRYEEIAEKFALISDEGVSVIVNYKDSSTLVERLRQTGPTRSLMRELGLYTVTIPKRQRDEFVKSGVAEEVWPGIFYIPNPGQYSTKTGLKTDNDYIDQLYII